MQVDAEFIEKMRSNLNAQISETILPWIEVDLFEEFGCLPFVNRVTTEGSKKGFCAPPSAEDIANERIFENSLGLFKGAAFSLSTFGVLDNLLRSNRSSNPILDLMTMEKCLGITIGAMMFCGKAYLAAKAGGKVRAKKYDERKNRVLEIYLKIPEAAGMSADAVAEEIIGRDGVNLSFRKIADTVREARKVQDAEQNAQSA